MKHPVAFLLLAGFVCVIPALSQKANPFLGRWDFNILPNHASWLGITEKDGSLDIWYQPTGGNVFFNLRLPQALTNGGMAVCGFILSGPGTSRSPAQFDGARPHPHSPPSLCQA